MINSREQFFTGTMRIKASLFKLFTKFISKKEVEFHLIC